MGMGEHPETVIVGYLLLPSSLSPALTSAGYNLPGHPRELFKNLTHQDLRLSIKEHWLPFQRAWVQFPAPR